MKRKSEQRKIILFIHFFFFCAQAPQSKEEKTQIMKEENLGPTFILGLYTTQ